MFYVHTHIRAHIFQWVILSDDGLVYILTGRRTGMKNRLLAIIIVAALVVLALPVAAFAAVSPAGQVVEYQVSGTKITVDCTDAPNIDPNQLIIVEDVDGEDHDALVAAIPSSHTVIGFFEAYFTNGIHENFGTLHITFEVGSQYNGMIATVYHYHYDGTLTTSTHTVRNGAIVVDVTDLSTFAISIDETSGAGTKTATTDTSSTSPKTGAVDSAGTVDSTVVVMGTIAMALGAGATFVALRKKARG